MTPGIKQVFHNERDLTLRQKAYRQNQGDVYSEDYPSIWSSGVNFEIIKLRKTGSWLTTNANSYEFDTTINLAGEDLKINVFFQPTLKEDIATSMFMSDVGRFGADANYIRIINDNDFQPLITIDKSSKAVYWAIYNYVHDIHD